MKTSRPAALLVSLLVLLVAALAPGEAAAQDLRYRNVTRAEFAGMMGTMMRLSGEGSAPDTTTTWLKGSMMRQDDGEGTTIMDMSTLDVTMIDHPDRSYWRMSMQQMMASADSARAEIETEMQEASRQAEASEAPELQVSVDVDRTGERRTINGYEAERVVLTMRVEPDPEAAENAENPDAAAMMGAGAMTWISEMWLSTEIPTWQRMQEAGREAVEAFAGADEPQVFSMMGNPQMAAAAQEMADQMEGLEGEAVRSVTFLVLVPTGVEFDRDAALAMSDEPLPRGPSLSELMGQAVAESAKESAKDAVKRSLGGLGGLFGRGGDDDEEEEEEAPPAPSQVVLMKLVTEIVDVEEVSLSDADFAPPADYTERSGPGMGG